MHKLRLISGSFLVVGSLLMSSMASACFINSSTEGLKGYVVGLTMVNSNTQKIVGTIYGPMITNAEGKTAGYYMGSTVRNKTTTVGYITDNFIVSLAKGIVGYGIGCTPEQLAAGLILLF